MNLQQTIRRILKEIRVDPSTVDSELGLFIKNNNFTLYNPNEDKVYGHIGITKLSSGNYYVSGVAAEYGYGPLMYELVMTYIHPKGLLPTRDGDVRGGAINIWNRFLKRKDVKKKSLTKKDSDFSWEVYEDFGNDPSIKFIQTIYYYNGINDVLDRLLKSGKRYLSDGLDINVVDEMGNEYWLSKYD
jgi:hypothetical protein